MQSQNTVILEGDKNSFAIECLISKIIPQESQLVLGAFCIWINGIRYGVWEDEATLLACSYDDVERRIVERGLHISPLAANEDGRSLINTIDAMIYSESFDTTTLSTDFDSKYLHEKGIVWAPDGDEAFDDGSFILQFDLEDKVRLIAIRDGQDFTEIWLESDDFYEILANWKNSFEEALKKMAP